MVKKKKILKKSVSGKPVEDQWIDELKGCDGETVMPTVGLTIECRIVIKTPDDFHIVDDVLEECRQYGAAEIVEYKLFTRE